MFRYLWTQTHSKAHAFIDLRIPFHIDSLFHCKQQSFYNPTLDIYLQRLANIDEKNAILGNSNSVTQIYSKKCLTKFLVSAKRVIWQFLNFVFLSGE